MKRFISFLLVLAFMLSFTGGVMAQERNIIIDPQSSAIFIAYGSNIWLQSGRIMCSSTSELMKFTNQSMIMELQKQEGQSWTTIKKWQKEGNHQFLNITDNYSASSGTYRVKGTHMAGGETKSSFSAILSI